MKPIKVEFQAFGPYADREVVDFEALSKQGLFLICGKTGVGKTMILDAITFALYGKSSGHGRDDFESMRCTKADFDKTTFVRFMFENNGETYRFERRLVRKRTNLSPEYNLLRKNNEGGWDVVLENAKEKVLNAKAVEIIGLEYEQFRQVMILPQGQFEKLLTSDSAEKEKILSTIFGEDKWKAIAEIFYDNAEKRKKMIAERKAAIKAALREEGCESIAELEAEVKSKQKQLDKIDEEFKKTDYDRIIKQQQDNLTIVNRFHDLHEAEKRVKGLEDQTEQRASWAERIKDAERADTVRSFLDKFDYAGKSYEKRIKELEQTKKTVNSRKEEAEAAADKLKAHIGKEAEVEEKKQLMSRYESIRSDYEGLNAVVSELTGKTKEESTKKKQEDSVRENYDKLTQSITALQSEYETLEEEHKDLLAQYLADITGEIASHLEEGKECPVCGSTVHPHKAQLSDNNVTKEMVDEKKAESEAKYKVLTDTVSAQQEKKKELDEKHREHENVKAEMIALDTKVTEIRKKLVKGIDTLDALNSEIGKLSKAIKDYNDRTAEYRENERESRDRMTEAAAQQAAAETEKKAAEKEYNDAESELKKNLERYGFETEAEVKSLLLEEKEIKALKDKVSDYDATLKKERADLEKFLKELSGKTEPDEEECRRLIDEAIAAKTDYAKAREVCRNTIERLVNKQKKTEAESRGLEHEEAEAEEDYIFAKKLRGDTGVSLQRYVLGIMFSSVVAAANKMLEMVHGGRYRLYRSDDKNQGNKTGLELKVFDKNSEDHEGRFVNTLSGGEKFLTSLALSIGLSTVAQKSGIKIEALFIDEGFGSLDEDSVADAMNVLDSIQKANGMVGIISHVRILQERIPSKLRVEDTPKGRHIVQTIG